MERRASEPRPNWPKRVESHGLLYHTLGGVPYWDESAYYAFRPAEIDNLELAAQTNRADRETEHLDRGDDQRRDINRTVLPQLASH